MDVTDEPIVNEPVKPEQPSNALLPMDVTDAGKFNEPVKPEQPLKA